MSFFTFLTCATVSLIALAVFAWRRSRSAAFPFGIAVFYFWSLHGAWAIITDQLGGHSGKRYHYLFDKVFPVYLDEYYFKSLVIYYVFIVFVLVTSMVFIRPQTVTPRGQPISIRHDRIIILCSIAALITFLLVSSSLATAITSGNSAYAVTRSTTADGWFRLHQVLNRLAIVPAAIGCAVLLGGQSTIYVAGLRHSHLLFGYGLVLGFMFLLCLALGNKNELALGLFSGIGFYVINTDKPRLARMAVIATLCLAAVAFIDFARGLSLDAVAQHVSIDQVVSSLLKLNSSNECFGAHISLYGILFYDVPLTYGSSFTSFAASVIPRFLWPNRPLDIYWHYADAVAAQQGQGYSIHHAAGWYLNFGSPGVFFGAGVLGLIWALLYNNLHHKPLNCRVPIWCRLFYVTGFCTFTSNLPNLIRSGPEGYKSIIIDSFFLPILILGFASCGSRSRGARNAFETPRRDWSLLVPD